MTEQELKEMIIDELKEHALENQRKKLTELNKNYTDELIRLSKEIEKILATLPKESAEIINSYILKSSAVAENDCRYLYEQGAKDCVKLLKQLEIL